MFERLREDIRCVFDRDPAARHRFEVVTTYPGVHALILHRLAHALWGMGLRWVARLLAYFSRWLTGIEIHPGATIGRRFFIDHGMGVVIGETAQIGDDCTLYHGVTLGGTSWEKGKRHPTLGNNVVVGAGAKILGPLHIGNNARVGSNAVVLKDIPAGATVVGIPGRITALEGGEAAGLDAPGAAGSFNAYGTTENMPDPVALAINRILDHLHTLDHRMDENSHALKTLGAQVDDTTIHELAAEELGDLGLANQPRQNPGTGTDNS
ncbi:serine O-acetyltransferase [Ectothiorhodosinus mongolicus]|uniref:Serine acetyltransferase n=1 Tax=Ectothiorhodosinus mongolicus TaxID=233100 RepID=A0A1R3W8Q8_9GAMM|nr:serine O-acetyltransferase [Ectothiorhodosinus mongolicus]ULX57653.1 serine O-acetyltransferase [Ectothiorhodosinus mongolicus]SIT73306.1 serine O-acetyltransferase [Ectothiorhodosinus mongolicus]